jgi:Tfp pilus assembly protein PilV
MHFRHPSTARNSETGFAMIEAVVAAFLLVVVVLGVLKGLDTANRSSGREKARAVAAALTEQDQERLRSFRAIDLANYDQTQTVTVNKIKYRVDSKAEWVRDSTGGTESCTNSASQADYLRIVTTTSSGLITTPIQPITMASLVAAPIGAFGKNQGTLGVQVNDRDGNGVPGLMVNIAGSANVQNPTNAVGCAIFAYVPSGTYTVTLNQAGWVDPAGNTVSTKGATVADGTVAITTMPYDEAASVATTFDTVTAHDGLVAAKATSVSGANSSVPAGGLRVWGAGPTFKSSITATSMFPFDDGYGMFGGGCLGADPTKDPLFSDYYDDNPDEFVSTEPGLASPAVSLRLPSTNLRVLNNGVAFVTPIHVVFTSKSAGCTEKFGFTGTTYSDGSLKEPALPFGDYQVCADLLVAGLKKRTLSANLLNHNPAGILPAPVLDMVSGGLAGTTATGVGVVCS